MTARSAIRQADIARVMRAAKRAGVSAEIDMATGLVRILPTNPAQAGVASLDSPPRPSAPYRIGAMAEDGEENW